MSGWLCFFISYAHADKMVSLFSDGVLDFRCINFWPNVSLKHPIAFMADSKPYYLRRDTNSYQDADGQPPNGFNAAFRRGRELDELLGICRGLIADDSVSVGEVEFLNKWIKANAEVISEFPASHIAARLQRIYADGIVTDEEREDLCLLLREATGSKDSPKQTESGSTTLPLDKPPPEITFESKAFSLTGKFVSGTRKWCVEQIEIRRGIFHDTPRIDTHFLVIGTLGSRDWAHSSFGRKIEKALEYRSKYGIRLVSEQHWVKCLI
jgi:hypothetical protein